MGARASKQAALRREVAGRRVWPACACGGLVAVVTCGAVQCRNVVTLMGCFELQSNVFVGVFSVTCVRSCAN